MSITGTSTYDGAGKTAGVINGCAANFMKIVPQAHCYHCASHSLYPRHARFLGYNTCCPPCIPLLVSYLGILTRETTTTGTIV